MIAWVDLETTGLNPAADCILEMTIVLTDDDLNPLGDTHFLITPRMYALQQMSAFVRSMHTDNGLLEDLRVQETTLPLTAQATALRQLQNWGAKESEVPLGGSSVHFDRSMLSMHMPKLSSFFHYRNVDMSTIKRCVHMWCPDWAAPESESAHRSSSDIQDTLALAHWYKTHIFTKGPKT